MIGRQRILLMVIAMLLLAGILVLTKIQPQLGLDLRGGSQLLLQVQTTAEKSTISDYELESVKEVVNKRVDEFGVSETVVQVAGKNKILVQLPGVNDPKEAEQLLKATAQLEFRKESPESNKIRPQLLVRQEELAELTQKLLDLESAETPADPTVIAQQQDKLTQKEVQIQELSKQLYVKTDLTGKYLLEAFPQANQGNSWNVALRFDKTGGDLFAKLTKELAGTGRTLGIFLDDKIISSATVGPEFVAAGIVGGNAVIQGQFDAKSARALAVQLQGGALPLPIKIIENRTVGATLGQDSIRQSILAGLVGLALVLIFMVVYYRLPGVIADISLMLYAVWNLAIFVLIPVTLSLPGIAGFILSIGMAVDANVLIFERTREELRAGKTLYRAVDSGFYRAFSSILDSNITTLIACAALYWLGSGIVKGFALTLAIGICISLFTALTCTRTLLLFVVLGFPNIRNKLSLFYPHKPEAIASS